jgi:hypothetical protein
VRAGISVFAQVPADHAERGLARLRDDLASGRWEREHRDLLALPELHLGYYAAVAGPP